MKHEELVKRFAEAVIAESDARKRGAANVGKLVNEYIAAFDAVCAKGNEGRETLTSLFDHERAEVRITAAAFLLRYAEDRARAVLVAEAKGKGTLAFEAAQALQRWEEGEWDLDPG